MIDSSNDIHDTQRNIKQPVDARRTNNYTHIEIKMEESTKIQPSIFASVVIPCYKGDIYLERTLYSLKNQSYPHKLYEVIIIQQDDGRASIEDLVSEFETDFELRLFKIPHIGFTPGRSRNFGIQNARGEIIISLDFDMICQPNFIEAHMKWHHASKNIATFGLRKFIDADNIEPKDVIKNINYIKILPPIESISNTVPGCTSDKRLPEIKIIKTHPFPCNCFHGCNITYPRKYALEIGGWDEDFNGNYGYQDIEFGYRLWQKGLYLVFAPEALAFHQENNVGTYSERKRGREINRILLYKKVPGIKKFRESFEKGMIR